MTEQQPEPTVIVRIEQPKNHTMRNRLIGGALLVGGVMYLGARTFDGGNSAEAAPHITAGVDHESEVWSDIALNCDEKVDELVGVTGIQHNVVFGGLTSGGLKVNKALAGDFLVCGDKGQITGKRERIMKDGKLLRTVLHFTNADIAIQSPRVDHLDPMNRAPLRAGDSQKTVAKKLADCAEKQNENACDDTGVSIMWPKLYKGKTFFGHGPELTIPGPKVAVNPDESLKLATLMNEGAQLAIAVDGTTIERWQNAVTSLQTELATTEQETSGQPVSVEAEPLPDEETVIGQRLDQLAPDLKGVFKEAVFQSHNHQMRLHLRDWHNAKLDIDLSDVEANDENLQKLNGYLKQYNIGTPKV